MTFSVPLKWYPTLVLAFGLVLTAGALWFAGPVSKSFGFAGIVFAAIGYVWRTVEATNKV
jgi:hypothetical protein